MGMLRIKDPEAVEAALAPRPIRMGRGEALAGVLLLAPAMWVLAAGAGRALWAGTGLWLLLATLFATGGGLLTCVFRVVRPSPPAKDGEGSVPSDAPRGAVERWVGVSGLVATASVCLIPGLGLLRILARVATGPVAEVAWTAVVLGVAALAALRGTRRGAVLVAHLRSLPAPRFLRHGLWGAALLMIAAMVLLDPSLPMALGATVMVAVLGLCGLALALVPLLLTEPEVLDHRDMLRLLRKSRATFFEASASELYRLVTLLMVTATVPSLGFFALYAALHLDLEALVVPGALLAVVAVNRGRITEVLPEGLTGARLPASSDAELRRPLLAGRALCRYCGAGIALEEAVVCAACESHHHAECWEEYGGCVMYACGGTRPRRVPAA